MKGNFQVIVIVICLLLAVFGVLVFSGAIPIGGGDESQGRGEVVLWGTVPTQVIAGAIEEFNLINDSFRVQYVEKSANTFSQDLLEALAAQRGPDLFFLPDNLVLSYSDKIFTIPYESYPLANFQNDFSSPGEVFLTGGGILAFPLAADPLMMYYNRSHLNSEAIVYPPVFWDEVANMTPLLTKKNATNQLIKSAVALGQFVNVAHAKEILSAMFMQTGNPIIDEDQGALVSTLGEDVGQYDLDSVLQFYTDFANPLNSLYSWNRSLPNSADAFSAENLTFYFGFASELPALINKNPNQNFLMAPFPQIRGANSKLTSARVTGVAISSSSRNFNTAYIAANLMASPAFSQRFASSLGMAPVRRDLLNIPQTGSFLPSVYASALYARSWLDPAPVETSEVFRTMVERVQSGALSVGDAVEDASEKLNLLLIQ